MANFISHRQLTDDEIRAIFCHSDSEGENEDEEEQGDSDDEELPMNLAGIEDPEEPEEPENGAGNLSPAREPRAKWSSSSFIPPEMIFDDSEAGVKVLMPNPTEADCFKLFLDEPLMESVVEETNRYKNSNSCH